MIGTSVSRYRILALLGGGGMGVVYEAEDCELGRRVALKFLPEETAKSAEALERFKREARAASALTHPHICTVYDFGTHEGRPYLVMERLSGHTLRHSIGDHGMPLDRVLAYGEQIADALEAAHRAGIVHRDLKPANLFITERDEAKVLDFGLAKMASTEASGAATADAPTLADEPLTEAGKTLGTVSYMSPEQARGAAIDARSDLFSLGVVLYEMATGRLPFEGESTAEVFAALLRSEPTPPSQLRSGIPARFDEVVLKALEKDRALRHQSAAGLRADLLRLQRDSTDAQPTSQRWAPAAEEAQTSPSRHSRGGYRARRIAVAAAAAAVVAALAIAVWRQRAAPGEPAERLSVLIGDTVNRTGNAAFDDTLTELLTTSLHQSRFLSLYPRARAAHTLRLMRRDAATPIDEVVGLEICQREGVGALVTASISPLGNTYLLLVRVTGAEGRELASARESFEDPADTPAHIDAVVRSLRAAVGESAASIRASSLPLAEVSSASLEAVKFYTLGLRHQRGGDPTQALLYFEKALAIDPEFAMAHDAVGIVYTNLQDMARAEVHLAKAAGLTHRVGEVERHKILADVNLLRRDYDVACRHLQVLTELRPLDPIPFYSLGICQSFKLDFAGAIASTERALRMQAYPLGRANLARFQLGDGQAEAALATAEALLAEQPTNLQARLIAGRAELALGRLEAARRTYELLAATGGEMEAEGRLGLADLELGTGRLDRARRELAAAWEAGSRRNVALALGQTAAAAAELALATGRRDELERAIVRLREIEHPVALYLEARCSARAGRPLEARATYEKLVGATSDSAPDRALRAMLLAELATAEGDTAEAMRQADAAWELEPSVLARESQARAYAAAARTADAVRLFEDVLRRHTQRLDSYDALGFHRTVEARYRLAVLLDEAGEHARATPHLEALLKLWEGADPALPAAEDARRRLGKGP